MNQEDVSEKGRIILHKIHDRGGRIESKNELRNLLNCTNWFLEKGLLDLQKFSLIEVNEIENKRKRVAWRTRHSIKENEKGKQWVEKDKETKKVLKDVL